MFIHSQPDTPRAAPALRFSSSAGNDLAGVRSSVVPANEASWHDLKAVLGARGEAFRCQCQRYKLQRGESFAAFPVEVRADRLRQQTNCGHRGSGTTSGLLAYLDGEPVDWCAVEPRPAYGGLLRVYRVPWLGRAQDRTDDSVWAVTCVLTRAGFSQSIFAAAGFSEVSRPTPRRVVMRIDF